MTRVNDPIMINKTLVRNRLTMAPTVKFDYAGEDGKATEKHIEHYKERAEHGCGLICVEATAVTPGGRFGKIHMGLWDDGQIDGHRKIAEACHNAGAAVIIQINHAGMNSDPALGEVIAPSEVTVRNGSVVAKEMSVDEIHRMQEKYADAAVRAKKAGYDGVQLHACHSYLINQFMSRKINRRTDEYGGNIENRARFCAEIIRMIRERCGEDFIISARTVGIEPDVATAIALADELVFAGCDYLQISTGIEWDDPTLKEEGEPYNLICKMGVLFHEHFKGRVPVSCVNGIMTPEIAKYLIENELVDTVDLGRAILADPAFCEAVLTGASYVKCFECPRCQYGPGMPHKCPAELKRTK